MRKYVECNMFDKKEVEESIKQIVLLLNYGYEIDMIQKIRNTENTYGFHLKYDKNNKSPD